MRAKPDALRSTSQKPRSKAKEDRFRFQKQSPLTLHTLLDGFLEAHDVAGVRGSGVDQSEAMTAGNGSAAEPEPLAEAGMLDQPGRGNLVLGIEDGIARDLQTLSSGAGGEIVELRGGEDRILEEGAGAAGVAVAGNEQHSLGAAYFEDGLAHVR